MSIFVFKICVKIGQVYITNLLFTILFLTVSCYQGGQNLQLSDKDQLVSIYKEYPEFTYLYWLHRQYYGVGNTNKIPSAIDPTIKYNVAAILNQPDGRFYENTLKDMYEKINIKVIIQSKKQLISTSKTLVANLKNLHTLITSKTHKNEIDRAWNSIKSLLNGMKDGGMLREFLELSLRQEYTLLGTRLMIDENVEDDVEKLIKSVAFNVDLILESN